MGARTDWKKAAARYQRGAEARASKPDTRGGPSDAWDAYDKRQALLKAAAAKKKPKPKATDDGG